MMQQPMYQQEQQPGAQDAAGHQMVLCPVRVVYETQMLVQPGEQIQPNQTIFINPQNPPPWIQNRAVQNQVIYVQHVPNYVQPTQQHIDPNQLYIQNYGYQNMPQMLVQNPQEQIRPMQMTPTNVVPNPQAGISQNVQTQRLIPNITAMPNAINIVNAAQSQNNPMNRQIPQSQISNINEIVSNVKQETVGPNIYRQVSQPIQQDPRNQMQQTVTIVPNNIQRPTNIYEQNVGQMQPVPQQNIANIQTTYQNAMIQDARKIPAPVNKNISYNVVHPNISVKGPQAFRPIQPRTNQMRPNVPHYLPVQTNPNIVQSTMPNILNKNVPRKIMPNTVQVPNSIAITSNGKIEDNNVIFNRKRKSESPDEIYKKISITNNPENPIIIKKIENVSNQVNCSDIGVNTSPIHKPDGRITINTMQITPLPSNHLNAQNIKIKEELTKKPANVPMKEPQNVVRNNFVAISLPSSAPSEKDKLVRNTVFTQARGRVLNDKKPILEPNRIEISPNNLIVNSPIPTLEVNQKPQTNADNDIKEENNPEPTKINNPTISPSIAEDKPVIEIKIETKEKNVISNKKAIEDVKVKEDRDFILTHVLDGYVIQESNIAFPIRKPLKEKALPNHSDETETKEVKEIKVEKDAGVKNNSKILNISHLHIKDIETIKNNEKINDKENPFRTLKPSAVKTWTAEQLETHLTKCGWNETVSVLQEHEIDGESLLLVSKGQLLTIGVKEEHADIISEFIKT